MIRLIMYSELVGFFLIGMFLEHLKIEKDLLLHALTNMEILSKLSLKDLSMVMVRA